jgi:hypothetical protein
MSSAVLSVAAAACFRQACAGFDPELLSGADCAAMAQELAGALKAGEAAFLLASARAVACGAHKAQGFNDGAAWMARQVGGTTGQARQALEAAAGLKDCPGTREALLAGELSLLQAAEIVRTEREAPGGEGELLEVARSSDLSQLRDKAREHRQANSDVADLHRRQLRARHFRHWTDELGMVCFAGALPPETGVPFVNRLELAAQRAKRAAQQAGGQPERFEAYAADALAAMAVGEGPSRPARAELVIVCDLFAWRRGHSHPGEPCQVIGGGPIPVELAHELGKDAFLKAVLHDGVAVHTIKHFGRHFRAELRTALDLGPPPRFSGARCEVCARRFGLEYDHVNPVANKGETSLANLKAMCWADHRAKTERDRQAGLLGLHPPGPQAGPRGPSPPDEPAGLLGPNPPAPKAGLNGPGPP